MLTAVIAHPPAIGAKLMGYDATRAKAVNGVRHVVPLDAGVAVVADGFWAAKTGRDALDVKWDTGPNAGLSTARVREMLQARLKEPGLVAREEGKATTSDERTTVDAQYEVPYLAQACMEPMNCTASVTTDGVKIWVPTQAPGIVQMVIAQVVGIPPERVKVTTTLLGGGFGRRSAPDFVIPAVLISKAVGAPVKLVYTREDDMRAQHYRPAVVANLRSALDEAGMPTRFDAQVASSSVGLAMRGSVDGVDHDAVEGLAEWPYATPRMRVDWMQSEPGVLVWYWRSVGNSHNAFFAESFIDELAHAAKQDPYAYRRTLLAKQPRHLGVLERAAKEAGWGTPLPKDRARGIAVHACFGSYAAEVVEATLKPDGTPRVHRVVCAVDAGQIVNPAIVRQQMRGSILYALSAALHGEITLDGGRVQQGNFDDYPVVRMDEAPVIDVHIVPSTEPPGGVGEPGTPPLAPALANALFVLTGKRVRRLPFKPGDFSEVAT
jgi:isoquinoline 1-oxidoreductase beta subunit